MRRWPFLPEESCAGYRSWWCLSTTATFLPLRSATASTSVDFRLSKAAPVINVSCVKSTNSERDSVLVVAPQRISIVLLLRASKRLEAVTGTYLRSNIGVLQHAFYFIGDYVQAEFDRIPDRLFVLIQKGHRGVQISRYPMRIVSLSFNLIKRGDIRCKTSLLKPASRLVL